MQVIVAHLTLTKLLDSGQEVCVRACVHMCVFILFIVIIIITLCAVDISVCALTMVVHIWRLEVHVRCFLFCSPSWFLRWGHSLNMNSTDRLDWQVSSPLRSSCIHPPSSAEIAGMHCQTWLFICILGIGTKLSSKPLGDSILKQY